MFTLKDVRYRNVLDIEDLNIESETITCILGESGSGKTTLLKLLNHLISCDRGVVQYKGQDVKAMDAVALRRNVVMLPQSPVIVPGTIKDNLLLGLFFSKKKPVRDDKLIEALSQVGIKKELSQDTDLLSGGEKQRLALGRIMLMNPETLLLDEPTSALDDGTEGKVVALLRDYVKKMGNTLIMVTHSRQVARKLGETIITINGGKIENVENEGEKE